MNHQVSVSLAAPQAERIWVAGEGRVRWYWDAPGERYHHQTDRSTVVGGAALEAGLVRLVGMRNVQSWPFPVQPQEAGRSVYYPKRFQSHPGSISGNTHHIVIVTFKSRWVWHRSIHHPALGFILGPDKVFDLTIDEYCQ